VVSLDIGRKSVILMATDQAEAHMSGETNTSTIAKFGTFVGRRLPVRKNAPWSHGSKVALWVSLGGVGWAAVIFAGYFIWSVL
jgi:hypothetical protein